MTVGRVTVGSSSYNSIASIDAASSRLAKLQQQLSSGAAITTPSDDPAGTVRALQIRGELSRNAQYQAAGNDAIAWLSTADTAYSSIVTTTQQARTLVLQALNTGANDGASNEAIAQQIDGVRTSLIALANTSYNGRPVFGGATANGSAYDSSGAYVGDSTGTVVRGIGPSDDVSVSAVGTDVFGTQPNDLFSTLQNIANTIRTNPSAATLQSSLGDLDTAISRVSAAQATEGAAYQRVQLAQSTGTASATALKTRLSGIEDADLAELAVKVTTANTTYQAALQTTASIGQQSLLDFLR
jgi:flagellar hook-associated protein 3 FlgL